MNKLNLPNVPQPPGKMNDLQTDANKALACLYIAVEKQVADDVNAKVRTYVEALERKIKCFEERVAELKKPTGKFGDRSSDGSGPTDD